MDCDEYRKAIAADPGGRFEGAEHAARCEACSAYGAKVGKLDEHIGRALAIEVPDLSMPELPPVGADTSADVVDRGTHRGRGLFAPAWLAAAAGLATVVLVFAFKGLAPGDSYYESLADQVLAHMDYEAASRRVTSIAVSDSTLADVLDPKVRSLDTGEGIVSYAMSCVINGHVVPHLVVQGRTGPITLILMPDEDVNDVVPLSGENVHGVILPADTGSIAIIGQREDQMAEVGKMGEQVLDSVQWSI